MEQSFEDDGCSPLTVEALQELLETYNAAASVWISIQGTWIRPTPSDESTPHQLILDVDITGLDENE